MKRTIAICLALATFAATAWAGPALQRLGEPAGIQVALSTTSSKALVRQDVQTHLVRGSNRLTFTWATDKVDAGSVLLRAPGDLAVGETIVPAGSARTLAWDVTAPTEGDWAVTISYLLADVKWTPSYRLLYQPGSDHAQLEGSLTLSNESGLALEDARLSLTLGRSGSDDATRTTWDIPDAGDLPVSARVRAGFLPQMALRARLVYRLDGEQDPQKVRQVLVLTPPTEGGLAQEALPVGRVSIVLLTEAGLPARSMAGELKYAPGEEFELDLGVERDIVVERTMLDQRKQNLDFDRLGRVAGSDTLERYQIAIRNHTGADAQLEVLETVLNTWEFSSRELHARDLDEGVVAIRLTAPAGEARELLFTMLKHSGTRIPK